MKNFYYNDVTGQLVQVDPEAKQIIEFVNIGDFNQTPINEVKEMPVGTASTKKPIQKKKGRSYTKAYREEIVRLVREKNADPKELAEEEGISRQTIDRWVKKDEMDEKYPNHKEQDEEEDDDEIGRTDFESLKLMQEDDVASKNAADDLTLPLREVNLAYLSKTYEEYLERRER